MFFLCDFSYVCIYLYVFACLFVCFVYIFFTDLFWLVLLFLFFDVVVVVVRTLERWYGRSLGAWS